ncbi:MAG: hypothetical protein KAS94_03240 [Desulfobulbaceae bacterium]|nr:hypothetical protein [Desulfobulbaceae bacterium]
MKIEGNIVFYIRKTERSGLRLRAMPAQGRFNKHSIVNHIQVGQQPQKKTKHENGDVCFQVSGSRQEIIAQGCAGFWFVYNAHPPVHILICAGGCNAVDELKDKQDLQLFLAEVLRSKDCGKNDLPPHLM